ncbi:N-acetylglucosaminyltransferase, partial [Streptomyces sp. SID10244]|nr:N-acetylglucosaminyltransferase [Streptomyces sp. SID10244]
MNTRDGRTIDELMADEDYRQAALYDAVERLRDEDAQMSASVPFSRGQKIIGLGTLAVIVVLLVVFPIGT